MKHILLFLLLPFISFAQEEIVKDTLFISYKDSTMFIEGYREYSNGSLQPLSILSGYYRLLVKDTAEAISFFKNQSENIAREYSATVINTPKLGLVNKTITSLSNTVTNLFGVNIRDSIQAQYKPFLLGEDWILRSGQNQSSVKVIEVGLQKVLRLELQNGTRLPIVVLTDRWFRVLNLDGSNREFHLFPNGVYASLDSNGTPTHILRKQSIARQIR